MNGLFRFFTLFLVLAASVAHAETLNELVSVQIVSNVPLQTQIDAARRLSLRHVRIGLRWPQVEPLKGMFDWRDADARIKMIRSAGMTPIITLFGGHPAYKAEVDGPPVSGEALRGFARFSAAIAQRYGGGEPGNRILYEIWNEPNTRTFWGVAPDPEAYARLAEAACRAIKADNPRTLVLALAMEGTPVKAPYFVPAYKIDIYRQWAERAATPGLMSCADGFSMHPYLNTPEDYLRDNPALGAFVARHWVKPTPPLIVSSEVGYAIDTKRGSTAADQAALDLRVILIGSGLKRRTNIYQSVDTRRDGIEDGTQGLLTFAGKMKPAAIAIQRLMAAIGDYAIVGIEPLPGRAGAFRFTARKGASTASVVWSTTAYVAVPLGRGVRPIDLFTGGSPPGSGDSVTVGAMPVLLIDG